MPQYTHHYGLIKPYETENYDVEVQNSNMDKIDLLIKAVEDTINFLYNELEKHKEDYAQQRQQDQLKVAKVEKELNNYKATMQQVNINQEPKQKATGYGVISLPPNAAEGQVSVSVKGNTETDETGTKSTIGAVRIKSVGKNLFDKNTHIKKSFVSYENGKMILKTTGTDGNLSYDPLRYGIYARIGSKYLRVGQLPDLDPYTPYVIRFNITTDVSGSYIRLFFTDGTYDSQWLTANMTTSITLQSTVGKKIQYLTFNHNGTVDLDSFQLERGNTATEYEPYIESTQYITAKDEEGKTVELRSLPNGTKDEIRVSDRKLIKRVSDEIVVDNSFNWVLETQRQNVDCVYIENVIEDNYNMTSRDNNFARISLGWSQRESDGTAVGFEIPETDIYKFAVTSTGNLRLIVPKGKYATLEDAKADLAGMTLTYQLAEPVEIPIQVSGTLTSYPNGTIYIERILPDAGVYTDKITILHQDAPIKRLDKLSKVDFMTGIETELDISQAEISEDKLSFTHPDLSEGDIVFFEYEYDVESTDGEAEVEFYDSRYVVKDTETGKFYKWNIVVANGQPSIKLVEV